MSAVVTYDDRDPTVRYSQPASGHHWTDQGSSQSYGGTLKLTRTRRASATITFTGTSITVWGLVSDRGTGSDPVSSYSIDGGPAVSFAPGRTGSTQPRIQFFKSDPLENRQHTLEIVNLVEGDFLWLDSFDVTQPARVDNPPASNPPPAPAPVPATSRIDRPASPNPAPNPTTTPANQPSTSRSQVLTTVVRSTVIVDGSSTITSLSTSVSTTSVDIVSTPLLTGSSDPSVIIAPQAEKSDIPVGVIVGGVIGGLAVVLLAVLVFLMLRKKGREHNLAVNPLSPPPTASAWTRPTRSQRSDAGQGHASAPSFGSSSNLMSERSDPSSVQPFPTFLQPTTNHNANNSVGAPSVLGRGISPSEPMGKRQMMMMMMMSEDIGESVGQLSVSANQHQKQPSFDSTVPPGDSERQRVPSPFSTTTGSLSTQGCTTQSNSSVGETSEAGTSVYAHGRSGYPDTIIEESPPAYSPKRSTLDDPQRTHIIMPVDCKT